MRPEPDTPFVHAMRARDASGEATLWVVRPGVLPTPHDRETFLRLAERAASIVKPDLRRILAWGRADEQCWVAVEPLAGPTLDAAIAQPIPSPPVELRAIALSLAKALGGAHEAGLVHGVLRPADVTLIGVKERASMLREFAAGGATARIGGVGLWTALPAEARRFILAGEGRYLAPEVRAGAVPTVRSDVYSVGVMLAELLVGSVGEGEMAADLRVRLLRRMPRLGHALDVALAVSPDERFASVAELAAEIVEQTSDSASEDADTAVDAAGLEESTTERQITGRWVRETWPRTSSLTRMMLPLLDGGVAPAVPVRGAASVATSPVTEDSILSPLPIPPAPFARAVTDRPFEELAPSFPGGSGSFRRIESAASTAPVTHKGEKRSPLRTLVLTCIVSTLLGSIASWAASTWVYRSRIANGTLSPPASPPPPSPPPPSPTQTQTQTQTQTPTRTRPVRPQPVRPQPAPPQPAAPVGVSASVIANASASETKCVAAMIPFGSFCIDRTEVFDPKTHYPLTGLTLDEAAAACRAAGKRLCTGREWESACRGDDGASYPYGSSFRRDPCNVRTSSIARSGTHPACVSASGALDMSGNAAEWVAGGHTRGGSALDRDDGRCSRRKRRSPSTRSLDIGFRCCADRPAAR